MVGDEKRGETSVWIAPGREAAGTGGMFALQHSITPGFSQDRMRYEISDSWTELKLSKTPPVETRCLCSCFNTEATNLSFLNAWMLVRPAMLLTPTGFCLYFNVTPSTTTVTEYWLPIQLLVKRLAGWLTDPNTKSLLIVEPEGPSLHTILDHSLHSHQHNPRSISLPCFFLL